MTTADETADFLSVCSEGGAVADDSGICIEHLSAACVVPLPLRHVVAITDVPATVVDGVLQYAHVVTIAPVDITRDPRPPLRFGALFTSTLRAPNGSSRIERSVDKRTALVMHERLCERARAEAD